MIVNLAPEILELILSYLPPSVLTSFARTCRHARDFTRANNQILWKASFLQVFDHPKHAWTSLVPTARATNRASEADWDWYHQLQRRFTAFNAVHSSNHDVLLANIEHIVKALLNVEETASYTHDEDGNLQSLNLNFLNRLQDHCLIDKIIHDYHRDIDSVSLPPEHMSDPKRPVTRSMMRRVTIPAWASQFHIIYGATKREEESVRSKAAARAIVYDYQVTGPEAEFGPFKKDLSGSVDWQTVEAISSLMHRIFATALKIYHLKPTGFGMNIPRALNFVSVLPEEDWAGVTGTWLGTYAFLDYRALVHYNFTHNQEYPLDLGNYEEACGDLMHLELKIDSSEELKQDPKLQTELPYCDDLPMLFFKGSSQHEGGARPSIGVRGSASLAPGGRSVRWRYIIRYAGADQWQLEGVQPNGVNTGPIYGLWSHVDHDDHGPMGPFYYAPAELCEATRE